MNVYDGHRMLELLSEDGFRQVDTPEQAELILLNTCSVRDKAEQKLLSALGRYAPLKASNPKLLIGVSGCVAQQEREALARKAPTIDLLFGPDAVARVRSLVASASESKELVDDLRFSDPGSYVFPRAQPDPDTQPATAFVTIQKGCDKVCTYCIVPFTRGREVSRDSAEVLEEVQRFVAAGAKEITLIGQNVNCYHGGCSFSELLRKVAATTGLMRLRYTTSYPAEMGEDVFLAHRDLDLLARQLHLPVQSGSNRILSNMRREHSIEVYLEKLGKLRETVPGVGVSTDIIVGFPGESEEDFEATMALVEAGRFDNIYSFIYSERPRTWTARHGAELGHVPHAIKIERLERLQARQREISTELAKAFVGRHIPVLIEGPSKKNPKVRTGHASEGWIVHLESTAEKAPVGAMLELEIIASSHYGLTAKPL